MNGTEVAPATAATAVTETVQGTAGRWDGVHAERAVVAMWADRVAVERLWCGPRAAHKTSTTGGEGRRASAGAPVW